MMGPAKMGQDWIRTTGSTPAVCAVCLTCLSPYSRGPHSGMFHSLRRWKQDSEDQSVLVGRSDPHGNRVRLHHGSGGTLANKSARASACNRIRQRRGGAKRRAGFCLAAEVPGRASGPCAYPRPGWDLDRDRQRGQGNSAPRDAVAGRFYAARWRQARPFVEAICRSGPSMDQPSVSKRWGCRRCTNATVHEPPSKFLYVRTARDRMEAMFRHPESGTLGHP